MIHERLALDRPFIVFDTETTGVDPAKDRIVEFGFHLYTSEGLQKSWRALVNPCVPIPVGASEVHGIYDWHMQLCAECRGQNGRTAGVSLPVEDHAVTIQRLPDRPALPICECEVFHPVPPFKSLAPSLAKGFTDCDFGGKNIRFDLRLLAAEMARAGVTWGYNGTPASVACPTCALPADAPDLICARCGATTVTTPGVRQARIVDIDRLEQIGEPRTLSHLYKKHLGKDLDGAHGALTDVAASVEILAVQFDTYAVLPRSLDALHALQWPGWIDTSGNFRFVNGVPTVTFGKHKGTAFARVPLDYWGWIVDKSDFNDEVKAIAREARAKRYPVEQKAG